MNFFNQLIGINKYVCGEESEIRKEYDCSKVINDKANEVIMSEETDCDTIIKDCLNIASIVKLLQPFYDGNHRTALICFGFLLEYKGYEFDYDSALNDMKNHKLNLPTFYDVNDEVGENSIKNFTKYIRNYDSQEIVK